MRHFDKRISYTTTPNKMGDNKMTMKRLFHLTMKRLFHFGNEKLFHLTMKRLFHFGNEKLFKFFNFDHNKMTIKDIRLLFGPSEFDRSIKNNHLKQELNLNEQAKIEFIEQDEYGFYIYKMTTSNGQQIYIVTTKKHNFD